MSYFTYLLAVADPGFRIGGGSNLLFDQFSQKLHENEEILGGGRTFLGPRDLPIISITCKLQTFGNIELAILPILRTLCVYEKLECANDRSRSRGVKITHHLFSPYTKCVLSIAARQDSILLHCYCYCRRLMDGSIVMP